MVQGDVNPLLRRLASVEVHDISIATLEIEDVFLGYYDGSSAVDAGQVREVREVRP